MLVRCKQNNLPIDVCLDMFKKVVLPGMLYGSEVWGFNNCLDLERIQLKFIKYLLNLKKNTPTVMVYGETGFLPVEYYIKCRMLCFWLSLFTGKQTKVSYKIYMLSLSLFRKNLLICEWLSYIKRMIDDCGMSYVFDSHENMDKKWLFQSFLPKMKYTLKDQILQKWQQAVEVENEKCFYYKEFNYTPSLKNYFSVLPKSLWVPLCKFRTTNHRLPIEFNSWNNFFKPKSDRLCNICDSNDIGDEYHYIMICPAFKELREIYIPKFYRIRPSVFKFTGLMKTNRKKLLFKLAMFTKEILNLFQ